MCCCCCCCDCFGCFCVVMLGMCHGLLAYQPLHKLKYRLWYMLPELPFISSTFCCLVSTLSVVVCNASSKDHLKYQQHYSLFWTGCCCCRCYFSLATTLSWTGCCCFCCCYCCCCCCLSPILSWTGCKLVKCLGGWRSGPPWEYWHRSLTQTTLLR